MIINEKYIKAQKFSRIKKAIHHTITASLVSTGIMLVAMQGSVSSMEQSYTKMQQERLADMDGLYKGLKNNNETDVMMHLISLKNNGEDLTFLRAAKNVYETNFYSQDKFKNDIKLAGLNYDLKIKEKNINKIIDISKKVIPESNISKEKRELAGYCSSINYVCSGMGSLLEGLIEKNGSKANEINSIMALQYNLAHTSEYDAYLLKKLEMQKTSKTPVVLESPGEIKYPLVKIKQIEIF